jgi:xanthine dehydrogenase FAD-binding subunit
VYDIEALYEAESVSHGIALLQEHPEAKIIAGGSDVLVQIREGRLAGCVLVSIQKLDELRGVSLDGEGALRIGALTSFSHITSDPLIQKHISVLGEAVDMVGGPQIRNIGTIGGNTCNGVTSADSASTLMAWDAVMEYSGPRGIRLVPIKEHYIKAGKTALDHDEILTAILIPRARYENYYGHYIKYAMRNAMDIATLGCSVNIKLSEDKKTIADLRISYGVAGPVPIRAGGGEEAGRGKNLSEETVEAVGRACLGDVNPRSSWRASRELRMHLVEELTKRALKQAVSLAGGTL